MFSLIYSKEFFTFRRFSGKATLSTNTRIESIMNRLGIKDRLISQSNTPEEVLTRNLDVSAVQQRVADFRASSLKFLTHALEA